MLTNLIFSLNIVLPLFMVILFGAFLKHKEFIDPIFLNTGNRLVFMFGIPANVFISLYRVDITQVFNIGFIVYAMVFTLFSFFAIWLFAHIFIKDKTIISAFVQGSFRGNYAILGVPLLVSILGAERAALGALVLAFVVPIYNVFSTVILAIYSPAIDKIHFKALLFAVAKNPIIIGVAIGIVASLSGITLPAIIESSVNLIAILSSPLALICLGGNITFKGLDVRFKFSVISTAIKLLILPVICSVVGYALGFRGDELTVLMIMSGVPTAVAGYAMALQFGGDGYTASTIILLTTLISAFTLTVFIYVFRTMGMIV
ncbi:MAG: AEC family transporter [Firmicutes bacterium]|nr:AEC family transporter [Bacillota bacterium]